MPKSDAEAVRWYRRAAEQGFAEAQHNLGWMLEEGIGVRQDQGESIRWYRLAAEGGLAKAQNSMGVFHVNGSGVPKDMAIAYSWFLLAAAQGEPSARDAVKSLEPTLSPEDRARGQKLALDFAERRLPTRP